MEATDNPRGVAPSVAWPHRIDVDMKPVSYEHGFCLTEPLLDLSSGTFPTGLLRDRYANQRLHPAI